MCTKGIFDKFRHGRFPNPFPNIVRRDGVFHGLAGKFFRGGTSEDAIGRVHQGHLRQVPPREISQPFPPSMVMRLSIRPCWLVELLAMAYRCSFYRHGAASTFSSSSDRASCATCFISSSRASLSCRQQRKGFIFF